MRDQGSAPAKQERLAGGIIACVEEDGIKKQKNRKILDDNPQKLMKSGGSSTIFPTQNHQNREKAHGQVHQIPVLKQKLVSQARAGCFFRLHACIQ